MVRKADGSGLSKEELRELEDLVAKKKENDRSYEELRALMAPLQKKSQKLYEQKTRLDERMGELIRRKMASMKVPDWNLILDGSDDSTYSAYCDATTATGLLYPGGVWTGTGQRCLQICSLHGRPNEARALSALIRRMTPLVLPMEGRALFSFMEHSLSESGTYRLEVDPASLSSRLVKTAFGRDRVEQIFAKPDDAAKFIVEHLWHREFALSDPVPWEAKRKASVGGVSGSPPAKRKRPGV